MNQDSQGPQDDARRMVAVLNASQIAALRAELDGLQNVKPDEAKFLPRVLTLLPRLLQIRDKREREARG